MHLFKGFIVPFLHTFCLAFFEHKKLSKNAALVAGILLAFSSLTVHATNYLISPSDPATTHRSLSGISLAVGDGVYFESGQTFTENVVISVNGVTVSSYDRGKSPAQSTGRAILQPSNGNAIEVSNPWGTNWKPSTSNPNSYLPVIIENLILKGGGASSQAYVPNTFVPQDPAPTYQASNIGNGIYLDNGNSICIYDCNGGSSAVWPNVTAVGITIRNVEINGFVGNAANPNNGFGIYLAAGFFQGLQIIGNAIHDNFHDGIGGGARNVIDGTQVYGITDLLIEGNTIYNNRGFPNYTATYTGDGIFLSGVQNALVQYNELYGNGGYYEKTSGQGPAVLWFTQSDHVTVQFNEAHHNLLSDTMPATTVADEDAFDIDGENTNILMQYNYSHDNAGSGFMAVQYGGGLDHIGNIIRFNISINDSQENQNGSIEIKTNGGTQIVGDQIYNNLVISGVGLHGNTAVPLVFGNLDSQNTFVNNIIITTNGNIPTPFPGDKVGANANSGNYYLTASSVSASAVLSLLQAPPATAQTVGMTPSASQLALIPENIFTLAPGKMLNLTSSQSLSSIPASLLALSAYYELASSAGSLLTGGIALPTPVDACGGALRSSLNLNYCSASGQVVIYGMSFDTEARYILPAATVDFFGNSLSSEPHFIGPTASMVKSVPAPPSQKTIQVTCGNSNTSTNAGVPCSVSALPSTSTNVSVAPSDATAKSSCTKGLGSSYGIYNLHPWMIYTNYGCHGVFSVEYTPPSTD